MTATDKLRRMLDERGVKWEDHSGNIERRTVYMTSHGWAYVSTINDRHMLVEYHDMQPEQAIDATLGRGECRLVRHGSLADWPEMVCWSCSVCGFSWHHSVNDKQFSYCPNCGREVVN